MVEAMLTLLQAMLDGITEKVPELTNTPRSSRQPWIQGIADSLH